MLTLGDQWVLLILQHAFLNGSRRFTQWRDLLGISESVLANRLKEMTEAGIFRMAMYHDGRRQRQEYLITQRGLDLWSLLVCMWTWEEQWVTLRDSRLWLEHLTCRGSTMPLLMCGQCGAFPVSARDTDTVDHSGGRIAGGRLRRHRRATRSLDSNEVLTYDTQTLAILGDRWSTLVLGASFMGATTFSAFEDRLGIAPSILSERLKLFVDSDVFRMDPDTDRRRRRYRLTPKGLAFFPVFAVMWDWANTHLASESTGQDLAITHRACGLRLEPVLACSACHERITRRAIQFHDRSEQPRFPSPTSEPGAPLGRLT
ncbi:MAG: winged helix-turn-helix transcriptional regulator [Nocardioidaceae bacterium]|nr:winged helix-turn-helix transcriptional regulator [Nocardioidaceae bacterium]